MLTLRRIWYFGILFLFSLTASALAADKPISFEADQVTVNKDNWQHVGNRQRLSTPEWH